MDYLVLFDDVFERLRSYKNRTIQEAIVYHCIVGLNRSTRLFESMRYAGGIESILVQEGYINLKKKLPYQNKQKILLFGLIKYTKQESYIELIIRLGIQYLEDKSVICKKVI